MRAPLNPWLQGMQSNLMLATGAEKSEASCRQRGHWEGRKRAKEGEYWKRGVEDKGSRGRFLKPKP